jgi:2,4-dienoyl-CoA reductase-like NADH-dependent reductase (Old Yellow Enzyme family)
MARHHYHIFSPARIGRLSLPNRLVRSATWDPCLFASRQMTDEVLGLYRALAAGGVGMVISGSLLVIQKDMLNDPMRTYGDIEVAGLERLADVVHAAGDCPLIAQLDTDYLEAGPSAIPTPFSRELVRPFGVAEIEQVIACFVEAIVRMARLGFDGVQLHAAHGGFLSAFLSPYSNRRLDAYGGSVEKRTRVVREIVAGARATVGDFPILIKMNGADHLPGGIDLDSLPALAAEIARIGIDAIEISGGMWECLARPAEELGFRPAPAPESHTRIGRPERQSYYRRYAEALDVEIPIILVGGNRDVERLEAIVQAGRIDLIALCRPLISEPGLPNRWREGRGGSGTDCISCNSCLYDMFVHPGRETPGLVRCVFKEDRDMHRAAQAWVAGWVEEHVVR